MYSITLTPEMYNLLTLPEVLAPSTTLVVEDADGYTHDVIEMITNAWNSIAEEFAEISGRPE